MVPTAEQGGWKSPHFVWAPLWYRPFMSTWAIWSKLCESNALTAPVAKSLLGNSGLHRSVFRAHGSDSWLQHAATMTDSQREDACCTSLFHPSSVETHLLRYCPVCMEQGFHCGCFQHLALTRCPVHNTALLDKCKHCGAPISSMFEIARTAAFSCRTCEGQLARDRLRSGAGTVNDSIWRATIDSLLWDRKSTPVRLQRVRTSTEAARTCWWGGLDPFVGGSNWRYKEAVLPAGGDNFDELAWKAFIALVDACSGPNAIHNVLRAADCMIACRPTVSGELGLSMQQRAAACVVALFGGSPAYERARRLSISGASSDAYWLFPQASTLVSASATCHAVIVFEELKATLGRALRLIMRKGVDPVPVEELQAKCRVLWRVSPSIDGNVHLQWRAPGLHRIGQNLCALTWMQVSTAQAPPPTSSPRGHPSSGGVLPVG